MIHTVLISASPSSLKPWSLIHSFIHHSRPLHLVIGLVVLANARNPSFMFSSYLKPLIYDYLNIDKTLKKSMKNDEAHVNNYQKSMEM